METVSTANNIKSTKPETEENCSVLRERRSGRSERMQQVDVTRVKVISMPPVSSFTSHAGDTHFLEAAHYSYGGEVPCMYSGWNQQTDIEVSSDKCNNNNTHNHNHNHKLQGRDDKIQDEEDRSSHGGPNLGNLEVAIMKDPFPIEIKTKEEGKEEKADMKQFGSKDSDSSNGGRERGSSRGRGGFSGEEDKWDRGIGDKDDSNRGYGYGYGYGCSSDDKQSSRLGHHSLK